ncbi:hypothetical protein [Anianabacter salinae]|uniref:hypothetical protein n=1 Tax=Anianabacter salinae TaxID=2851023 RepID=UPI00225DFBB4|nr:hypothetical protein [Anianabacter salinae]MBV0912661.1 hypothetical protein [Anianabacter salinae]
MKRLLTTTALVLATATAGVATAQDSQIRNTVSNEIATLGMDIDVSTLSQEQVAELYTIITSTDDSGDVAQRVRAVIADNSTGMSMDDADQLRQTVANELATYGMDVDVALLTDEEVSELYAATTSTDDEGTAMQRVRGILAGSGAVDMNDPETLLVVLNMEQSQFDAAVENALVSTGYTSVDVSNLSTSQKAEIYTLATSSEMGTDEVNRIGAIVGM